MSPAASQPHRFHPTVLREYDIRGIVGQTLTEADARAVGRAFGAVVVRTNLFGKECDAVIARSKIALNLNCREAVFR